MNLLDKAIKVATKVHKGQFYNNGQFIAHPLLTALILKMVGADENLICAGFLHDTLEETSLTYKDLKKKFNKDIADLVKEVTESEYNTFPNLHTQRGIMLKFADRLSNIANIGSWDKKRQEKYLKKSKFWK